MLQNWLKPVLVKDSTADPAGSSFQLIHHVRIYEEHFPELQQVQVALLGLDDPSTMLVRRYFYQLSNHFENIRIADIGNIRKRDQSFLIPVIDELLQAGIIPVVFGKDVTHSYSQFRAHLNAKKDLCLSLVDDSLPLDQRIDKINYLEEIISNPETGRLQLNLLGYQNYFINPASLGRLQDLNCELIRLGKIKQSPESLEPIIRDSDLMVFHLSALAYPVFPGQGTSKPAGLSLEEACILARYAGFSDRLRSIGLYGFYPEFDRADQSAQVLALLIWHFLEGVNNRKQEYPVRTEQLIEYVLEIKKHNYQLIFYKSPKSGRWWLKPPFPVEEGGPMATLIPCTYEDYLAACSDELPERLLNVVNRYF